MADLLNATIEITEEASTSKGQYGLIKKIKGKDIESGKTNTYTIYETKQDGTLSAAWLAYGNGALLGQTVQVGYDTKDGTLPDGTPYTQRIIRSIDADAGNGRKNYLGQNPPSQTQSPRGEAPAPSQTPSRNWDREAYEKCCSIWAAAVVGKTLGAEAARGLIETDEFYKLFQAIRQSGYEHFEAKNESIAGKPATSSAKAAFDRGMEKAQATQVMEGINVEDVPF